MSVEILLAFLILVWGVNFPIVKAALQQFTPLAFNALRFILAASALWLAAWQRGVDMRLTREEVRQYSMLGLLGVTLYQILFIEGIARTTAGNSALILNSSPILIACGSHLLGHERLRGRTMAGALLAFAGLYFIITGKPQSVATPTSIFGDLLTLAAASIWAAYTIMAQSYIKAGSALKVTAYATAFGTIPLLLWCAPALAKQNWQQIEVTGWCGLLFSALLSIAAAQLIWNLAVSRIGSTRTSLYSNLVPVVGLIAGVILLGERVSMLQTFGTIATLAGVALARWQR
ncbi:MAG: DMT family transporter [bacterium]